MYSRRLPPYQWLVVALCTPQLRVKYLCTSSHHVPHFVIYIDSFVAGVQYEVLSTIFTTQTLFGGNLTLFAVAMVILAYGQLWQSQYIKRTYVSISFERCQKHFDVRMRVKAVSTRISNEMVWVNFTMRLYWFKELPWGLLAAQWYQNFCGTTIVRGGQFKAKTGEFGLG